LRRLPRVLREFRGIYVKREKKHAAETLARASAILAAALRRG
jgi:hypothetical protein